MFKVRDTEIATKWFAELSNNYPLFETDRFDNWGQDKQYYIDILNEQIRIINAYVPVIDMQVSSKTNQQDLNYLHKFFEDLRGEVDAGTEWFNNAPKNVQDAVTTFNIVIHQLESTLRTNNAQPTLVVTFKDRPRYELTEDDMKHFTYCWTSGTVYVNYCQVGKTVLDAFTNRDDITQAIRPQTHYSADFMIKFGPSTNKVFYWLRSLVINMWLKYKRFNFKHLNIGMIPVADLVTVIDKKTLVQFNKVEGVKCIK